MQGAKRVVASSHRRCKLHIPRPGASTRAHSFRCISSSGANPLCWALLRLFICKFHIVCPGPEGPGLIHFTAPPFQIEPTSLGFNLVLSLQIPYRSPRRKAPGLVHSVASPLPGQTRYAGLCPGYILRKFHIVRPGPEGPWLIHSTAPPFQIEPASLGFNLAVLYLLTQ